MRMASHRSVRGGTAPPLLVSVVGVCNEGMLSGAAPLLAQEILWERNSMAELVGAGAGSRQLSTASPDAGPAAAAEASPAATAHSHHKKEGRGGTSPAKEHTAAASGSNAPAAPDPAPRLCISPYSLQTSVLAYFSPGPDTPLEVSPRSSKVAPARCSWACRLCVCHAAL